MSHDPGDWPAIPGGGGGGSTGCSGQLSLVMRWAWLWCRQISVRGLTVVCPGVLGIGHKGRAAAGSSSFDNVPVTGSLLFNAPLCHLTVYCAAGLLISGSDCIRLAVWRLLLQRVSVDCVMATDGDAPAEARSGIIFGVPWNTPETFVQLESVGVVDLDTVPDVLGLTGRRLEVAVVCVLQGWDERSVRTLIPDPRVLERGFHDVTIVDMEDSAEPAVSEDDLSPASTPVASDGMAPERAGCYVRGCQDAVSQFAAV